jgi:hypothetical protein
MAKKELSYDDRQTLAVEAVRERLRSIIVLATEALEHIGDDRGSELIDDIRTDAGFAADGNEAILLDRV